MRTKSFTTMKLLYSFVFIVLVKFVSGAPSSANPLVSYDVVYSWKQLDFDFQSPDKREELIKSNKFVPQNNVIAGIKVHGENVFLSVPRWKSGVPASLVRLPYKYNAGVQASKGVKNGPKLVPYPSWEMNEKGNCSALQNVQSMDIDQYGRLWALDVGRVNIMEEDLVENSCAPKLVLINLNTNEVLSTHEFPDTVVDPDTSFLNDIVVGCKTEEDCWAYISDAADAKIVVFDLANNASWFVQHSSMEGNPEASTIQTLGQKYSVNSSVNGIALSPLDTGFSTLFYSPLSSYQLYSVPTEALQKAGESSDNNGTTLADEMVKTVGTKSSQSAGMIIDAGGLLYYGLLNANAVNYWNTTYSSFSDKNQALLVQSDIDLQYPDSFSIDTNGYAFVTTNRLAKFLTNSYDFETINFRVVRFFVGLKSYQYAKNDTVEPNLETVAAEPEAEPESEPESEPTAEPETSAAEPEAEPTSEPEPESAAEPESEPNSEPEPENEPEPTGSAEGKDKKQVPITGDDKDLYHNHDHHEEVLSNDLPEQRSLGGNGAGNIEHMQLLALLTIAMIATRLF